MNFMRLIYENFLFQMKNKTQSENFAGKRDIDLELDVIKKFSIKVSNESHWSMKLDNLFHKKLVIKFKKLKY